MFAVKRYAGDARPCHRRHLRRRRTLKVSHHLGARGVRRSYLVEARCSRAAIAGSTSSRRCAFNASRVATSSTLIKRL